MQNVTLDPFTQGDTPLFTFAVSVGGSVPNLDGYEGLFTITAVEEPTSDSAANVVLNDILAANSNTFNFQVTSSQTSASTMPANTYNWSFKLKDPSATYFTTLASGTVEVFQSYTTRTM